jgi:predicted nucleic acid-binding protein
LKYLLDSNILIYHLNGESIATDFILANKDLCFVSRISYIEVLSFELSAHEESEIKQFLDSFNVIDTNREIALQSIINRRIRKIKIPDNIIASTAQVFDLTLVTRNTDDFSSLDIKVINIFNSL